MNSTIRISALIFFAVAYGCKPAAKLAAPVKEQIAGEALLKNGLDSLSYAMGLNIGSTLRNQGVEGLNTELLNMALRNAFAANDTIMDEQTAIMTIQQKMQEYMQKKVEIVKAEGKKFLEENKKRPGVKVTASGLQYEILKEGAGPKPLESDIIRANYIGTLLDGKEFDNSYKRGQPLEIKVGDLIKGWIEALQMMPVGSKWKLWIPSDLGYGDRGAGSDIPGGSTIIFETELLEIVKK